MEQQQLFFIAIVLIVLWMLMGHSSNCDCSKCRMNGMPNHIRYGTDNDGFLPGHIRMRREEGVAAPTEPGPMGHIRMSDKYFGATQHVKHHLRRDNRSKLMNGIFSGTPQHIRRQCEDGMPC